MKFIIKLLVLSSIVCVIVACSGPVQPTVSAFQRNVGPGSTVTGQARDALGSPNSGNTRVLGVSSAGSLGGN